jgi:pimeloyl-ACP methyl ester carboxylesterase
VSNRYVVFSHGQQSGPWGRKITVLADTARAEGYEPESVDYRGIDAPQARLAHLMDFCKDLEGELVLVGSSLGAYVSVAAASHLHARGVFLMAPAIFGEGLPPLRKGVLDCPTMVVHGWDDEVIPFADSARFAREYGASLHLLHDDHRLHGQMNMIRYLFEYFLISLDMPASGE